MSLLGNKNNTTVAAPPPPSHWRRRFLTVFLLILTLSIAYTAFVMYYIKSEGERTGVVRKLSRKGYVFKTWEGELQMSSFVTPADPSQTINGGNIWIFSSEGTEETIDALKKAEQHGQRVTLHYKEYVKTFFWRGDTPYFITGVVDVK